MDLNPQVKHVVHYVQYLYQAIPMNSLLQIIYHFLFLIGFKIALSAFNIFILTITCRKPKKQILQLKWYTFKVIFPLL